MLGRLDLDISYMKQSDLQSHTWDHIRPLLLAVLEILPKWGIPGLPGAEESFYSRRGCSDSTGKTPGICLLGKSSTARTNAT